MLQVFLMETEEVLRHERKAAVSPSEAIVFVVPVRVLSLFSGKSRVLIHFEVEHHLVVDFEVQDGRQVHPIHVDSIGSHVVG